MNPGIAPMLLDFPDRPREGHLQSADENGIKLFVHGVGFVVVEKLIPVKHCSNVKTSDETNSRMLFFPS